MLNLPMNITCLILTRHGGYSRWRGACARVRPCNVDKSERSSSGSRHAPRTSPHQALSAFTSSGPTSGRQVTVTANHVLLVPVHRDPVGRIAGGTASLLFSRAIRLRVKRGAPEHRDSGGQAPRRPDGDGDGPQGTAWTPRASRGLGPRWLMRSDLFAAHLQLPQHFFNNRTR